MISLRRSLCVSYDLRSPTLTSLVCASRRCPSSDHWKSLRQRWVRWWKQWLVASSCKRSCPAWSEEAECSPGEPPSVSVVTIQRRPCPHRGDGSLWFRDSAGYLLHLWRGNWKFRDDNISHTKIYKICMWKIMYLHKYTITQSCTCVNIAKMCHVKVDMKYTRSWTLKFVQWIFTITFPFGGRETNYPMLKNCMISWFCFEVQLP